MTCPPPRVRIACRSPQHLAARRRTPEPYKFPEDHIKQIQNLHQISIGERETESKRNLDKGRRWTPQLNSNGEWLKTKG